MPNWKGVPFSKKNFEDCVSISLCQALFHLRKYFCNERNPKIISGAMLVDNTFCKSKNKIVSKPGISEEKLKAYFQANFHYSY